MNRVVLGPEYFPNPTAGRPVSGAQIYVGEPDTDPEILANQKTVSVLKEDGLTVSVSQPVECGAGGVPLYNGSPVSLLVDGSYSIKVLDASGTQIYYVPKSTFIEDGSALLLADLKGITGTTDGSWRETTGRTSYSDGGGGTWAWDSSDLSSEVTSDTLSGIYAAPTSDPTGASGAWVRQYEGVVNVKWFGATGNGTTNDTAAINAALAYAETFTYKPTVSFPNGEYLYDGGGVLGTGVVVLGESRKASKILSALASPTDGYLFKCLGHGSGVESMEFGANVTQTGGTYVSLVGAESYINDFHMNDLFVGITMTGNVSRIRHGRMQDIESGGVGIISEGGDNSQIIDDVLMGAPTTPNIADAGIRVRNSSALMITNTSVIQYGTGLSIDPTGVANSVYSLYVNNCFFDNCTKAMNIVTSTTAVVERCRFANSWFSSSTNDGVSLLGDNIKGMHFESCHILLNGGSGLSNAFGTTEDVTIVGGIIAQNAFGCFFNTAIDGLTITGATIGEGGGLSGNTGAPVVISDAASTNIIIKNNRMVNNGSNISDASTSSARKISDNVGVLYTTSPQGVATILNGNTSVTVNHGLNVIPDTEDITINQASALAGGGSIFVDTTAITTTTFDIKTESAVSSDIIIRWSVKL